MSFSFPHLVWIFQKAFSGLGLSYFETLLIDDWCCHYWSSPSGSSWCRFRVWRAELWAILFSPSASSTLHCHSQLGHHYLTYLNQWSAVLRICYTWCMMIFSNTTDPSSWFPSLSLWLFFHTFSNHSGIWTLSRCAVTIPDPNPHPHIPKREASSPQFSLSSFT